MDEVIRLQASCQGAALDRPAPEASVRPLRLDEVADLDGIAQHELEIDLLDIRKADDQPEGRVAEARHQLAIRNVGAVINALWLAAIGLAVRIDANRVRSDRPRVGAVPLWAGARHVYVELRRDQRLDAD